MVKFHDDFLFVFDLMHWPSQEIGISQEQFANELGVSHAAIGYYESRKQLPDIAFIYALHVLTGVNVNHILGIEENMKPITNTNLNTDELDDQQIANLSSLIRSLSFSYLLSKEINALIPAEILERE